MKIDSRLKPIIKWAGGKSQLLPEIRLRYPVELGKSINKYAEPFIGGAAVLLDILGSYDLQAVFISDTNAELINLYGTLRDRVEELIKLLHRYRDEFLPLTTEDRKKYYYAKRERFNKLKHETSQNLELAALFVFINKTCFNGLYRVNSKGDFNVPMGVYSAPPICDDDNLRRVSAALAH